MEEMDNLSEETFSLPRTINGLNKLNQDRVDSVRDYKTTLKFKQLEAFVKKYSKLIDPETPVFIECLDQAGVDLYKDEAIYTIPEYVPEGMESDFVKGAPEFLFVKYLRGREITFNNVIYINL